jgi:hypothetical protein
MGAQAVRDVLKPVRKEIDELARFSADLLLADRWFNEAAKAWRLGDREMAEEYRCRGEAIHDRIIEILGEPEH